jgi:8-oxo-dGTP pyrophosphatase MutT (NUDIX family)
MYGPRARQQLVLARTDDISFLCAWSTRWNGFGGKVEPSDQSIAAAALRELDEEAGIRATDLRYRGRVVFGPGEVDADVSVDMRLFSCTAFEGEVTACVCPARSRPSQVTLRR